MGKTPAGIFDMFYKYRLRSRDSTANPNNPKPEPVEPVNEVLVDALKAQDADIKATCAMADGYFQRISGNEIYYQAQYSAIVHTVGIKA